MFVSDSCVKFIPAFCVESEIGLHMMEGGKGGIVIPFHAQILTKFTRHVLNQSLSEKPQGNEIFHDQTQVIHESRIPHEINHASHAFRYSRITFLFK